VLSIVISSEKRQHHVLTSILESFGMLYGIVVVLVVTGKETGLDVNAEKAISLYMVRS